MKIKDFILDEAFRSQAQLRAFFAKMTRGNHGTMSSRSGRITVKKMDGTSLSNEEAGYLTQSGTHFRRLVAKMVKDARAAHKASPGPLGTWGPETKTYPGGKAYVTRAKGVLVALNSPGKVSVPVPVKVNALGRVNSPGEVVAPGKVSAGPTSRTQVSDLLKHLRR